mgnify:CR=1 FL=1
MSNNVVWVIDDDPIFRMIVKTISEFANEVWEVSEFPNVQDANKALKETAAIPDAILLDVNIPVGGGWVFLEEFENMRSTEDRTKLYICSSSIDVNDKSRAASSPAVRSFIEKPLPNDFFSQLESNK